MNLTVQRSIGLIRVGCYLFAGFAVPLRICSHALFFGAWPLFIFVFVFYNRSRTVVGLHFTTDITANIITQVRAALL
jgi:hypothetical protein